MSGFLSVLQDALMTVFDGVLKPVLIEAFKFIVNSLIDIIIDTLSWIFYLVWTTLLQVVGVLAQAFDYFSGTNLVNDGTTTVLEVIFHMDFVAQMLSVLTLVGMAMAMIFSIINVIKSMSDMTLENKNPISKVMANAAKSMVTFAIIPLLCIFLMQLSNRVIDVIEYAADTNDGASIDRIIWYNCSLNASKYETRNLNGTITADEKKILLAGNEASRARFLKKTVQYGNPISYAYNDVEEMGDKFEFDYGKFDYGLGFAASIMLILVLVGSIMIFVARIFELVALYLTGPLFAATIANDGGEMFKQWKDFFIAKFLGGYGMILGMKLYIVFIPALVGGDFVFTTTNIDGMDGKFNAFIKLLIIVGGAYAVYSSQTLILRLLSVEAAGQAESSAAVTRAYVRAFATMGASVASKPFINLGKGYIQGEGGDEKSKKKDENEGNESAGVTTANTGTGNLYRGGRPE